MLCVLLSAVTLKATTATWIGGTGRYSDGSNWSTGVGPDGTVNIVVSNGGTVEVERDEASANATIDGSSTFAILDGAGIELGEIGTLVVGNIGNGTFTVGNQAEFSNMVLQSNDSYFGYFSGAQGILESNGGLFYTNNFYLGYGGNGSATLTSGAQLFTGLAWLGYLPDSTGSLTLNGSNWRTVGIQVTDYPDATIGNDGTGELHATNSQIEVGNLILAANASSSSSVTISGGSLESKGDIIVGLNGTASFQAIDAEIEARDFFVGRFDPGGTGEAGLSGGSLTLSADLHVGALGTGTFTLSNDGTIQSDIANIGFGQAAEGTVNISSGQWANNRAIFVGVEGKGTLNIEAQGVINSEGGYIGQDATGQGTVNMSSGSWTISGTLGVGVYGVGNFTAADGAAVTSQFAQISLETGSIGNVQVIGSSWTTTETLTIGLAANGIFQVTGNSTVTAGSIELGAASGVNGSLLIENSTLITDNLLPGGGSGTVDFDNTILQVLGGSSVNTILMDGFGTGDVTIKSGGLTVNTNGAEAEIASVLNGTGALTKTGDGRLRLTTDNTYTGGTNIQGGVLELTGNNTLGTGNVELGTAGLRAYTDSTVSGDLNSGIPLLSISGNQTGTFSAVNGQTLTLAPLDFLLMAGSIMQVGSTGNEGNVVLAPTGAAALAANTAINVAAGTLTAGNNGLGFMTSMASSTTVTAGATLDFQDNLSTGGINELFGAGTVNTGSSSNTTLTVGSGNFTGLISGQGTFIKNTSGTLLIGTGGNILVDGGVSVDAGTLVVNGSIGNGLGEVEVNAGGTLAGSGLVGPVKLEGGILSPGNSAGTLTAADLLWYAGILEFDLGSNQANSDQLIVGTLQGFYTSYAFSFLDNNWQLNTPYTLIQFASTNIPDASQFNFTNGGGFDGNFAFQGNSLQFTMTAIPEPGTATLLLLGLAAWFLLRRKARVVTRR